MVKRYYVSLFPGTLVVADLKAGEVVAEVDWLQPFSVAQPVLFSGLLPTHISFELRHQFYDRVRTGPPSPLARGWSCNI